MYTVRNFKTKKALKEALKEGPLEVYKPSHAFGLGGPVVDGTAVIEGPHYPQPHRFYAEVLIQGGKAVKVVS